MVWLAILVLIITVFFVFNSTFFQEVLTKKQNAIKTSGTHAIEMTLTPEQIKLIQQTWNQILPDRAQFGEIFYRKLFELDPSVRVLFRNDLKLQSDKFTSTLSRIVFLIDKTDKFSSLLQEMGRRHIMYGVTDAQYAVVGSALLLTLEQGLGDTYTEKVKQAWLSAYGIISKIMTDSANN